MPRSEAEEIEGQVRRTHEEKEGGTDKKVREEDREMLNGDCMQCSLGGLQYSGEMSIPLGDPIQY